MKRKPILDVLNKIKAGLDDTSMEQTTHFIFSSGHVLTYNDRISMAVPFDADFELTVTAEDLRKVIADIPEDEIDLEQDEENEQLLITSESTAAGIAYLPIGEEIGALIKSLGLPKLKKGEWTDLPKRFVEGLSLCSFSASKDTGDEAFSAIHVHPKCILSSDMIRISRFTFEEEGLEEIEFALSLESVKEMVKFQLEGVIASGPWAQFRDSEGVIFSTRTVDSTLPEQTETLLKVEGDQVVLPDNLGEALKAVLVFAPGEDEEEKMARITFKKGEVMCESERAGGWIERTVPVKGMKKPGVGAILINPIFFRDILRMATTMICNETSAKFITDRFEHVIALPEPDEPEGR